MTNQPRLIGIIHRAAMMALSVPRKLGAFGTPGAPRYMNSDQRAPSHLFLCWPRDLCLRIAVPSETYYDSVMRCQVLRPLHEKLEVLMSINEPESEAFLLAQAEPNTHYWMFGAPTEVLLEPRDGPRRKVRSKRPRVLDRISSVFPTPVLTPTTTYRAPHG